ncbi:flagellar hook-length control protein FliK [Roseomonas sp. KE2513]|nr:flagellar hook-length control protein FliK [Roseomonas sp. KE2513]
MGELAQAENAPALPWPAMPADAGVETGALGLMPPNMAGEAGVSPQEPLAVANPFPAGAPIAGQVPPPASSTVNPAAVPTGTARAIGTGRAINGAANRAASGASSPTPGAAGSAAAGEVETGGTVAKGAEGARKASAPSEKQVWAEHPGQRADGPSLPGSPVAERLPGSAPSSFEALLGEGGKASEAGQARAGGEATAASVVPATASSALPVGIMPAHSPPPAAMPVLAPPPEAGPAPRLMPRVAPAEQVAPVAIALALGGGTNGRISLSLDPVELGRVEVTVERVGEGARVQVAAERPETLALLARDGASLERALGGAGIGGDGGRSISFSLLGGDAGGQGNAFGNGQGRTGWSESGRGGQGGGQGGGRQGGSWRGAAGEPPEVLNTQHRVLLGLLDIAI